MYHLSILCTFKYVVMFPLNGLIFVDLGNVSAIQIPKTPQNNWLLIGFWVMNINNFDLV